MFFTSSQESTLIVISIEKWIDNQILFHLSSQDFAILCLFPISSITLLKNSPFHVPSYSLSRNQSFKCNIIYINCQ